MTRARHGLLAFAAALVLATGCQSSAATQPSATPTPTITPVAGSIAVEGLSLRPPTGMRQVDDRADYQNPKASLELVGKRRPPALAPSVDVFVETGDVGDLQTRRLAIRSLIDSDLQQAKVITDRNLHVPGAKGGRLIEFTFTGGGTDGKHAVRCHQTEVLVQMKGKPHYGVRYFAPAAQYDGAAEKRMLSSLRAR